MKISLIAAIGKNRALGKNNDLIYKIPQDLKRFKELTLNHPVVMGRKTFDSLKRPQGLPQRLNIIISRTPGQNSENVMWVSSLEEALHHAANYKDNVSDEVFILGGAQIFEQVMDKADKLYLTIIDDIPEADVYFPDYSEFNKEEIVEKGNWNNLSYTFVNLEK